MIERHTFKALINSVVEIEEGITKLEKVFNCLFDQNWLTATTSNLIRAIAEGFFGEIQINSLEEDQADTIEELLYHFIYMEGCGNNSEHCKSKLIIVDEGKESQHAIPCTNIDELYNAIDIYLNNTTEDFTFNYCHSHILDDEVETND